MSDELTWLGRLFMYYPLTYSLFLIVVFVATTILIYIIFDLVPGGPGGPDE